MKNQLDRNVQKDYEYVSEKDEIIKGKSVFK